MNNTNKYAIFSDIDGTIITSEYKNIKKNNESLAKLNENISFVFCTGNAAFFTKMTTLSKELNVRYAITSNGASIYDYKESKYLFKSKMDKNDSQKLLDKANELNMTVGWWDEDKFYHNSKCDEKYISILESIIDDKSLIIKTDKIVNEPFKIEFYNAPTKVADIFLEFASQFDLEVARMANGHVEITNKEVSKGFGVKWFCENNNIDLTNTCSIGDSANDIPMFRITKHSYVMANAANEIKLKANRFTSSVEQDGFGEAIVDFIYREKLGI